MRTVSLVLTLLVLLYLLTLSSTKGKGHASRFDRLIHLNSSSGNTTRLAEIVNSEPRILDDSIFPVSGNCEIYSDKIDQFIDTMYSCLSHDYSPKQADYYCQKIQKYLDTYGLFIEVPLTTLSSGFIPNTEYAIQWALAKEPKPLKRVDSASRIVNYVFTHYSYGVGSLLNPKDYSEIAMNDIGEQICLNKMAGLCEDLTHFLGIIISTKFPWWGTPVALSTKPKKLKGHTFLGMADKSGNINMMMDPVTNVIWVDSNDNCLSLSDIQTYLLSSPKLVCQKRSTVFGNKQKQFFKTRCILSCELKPEGSSAVYEPITDSYVIQAEWYNNTDTSSLNYRAFVEPYWAGRKFPGNTWANNCLIIDNVICSDSLIREKVEEKYKAYAEKRRW